MLIDLNVNDTVNVDKNYKIENFGKMINLNRNDTIEKLLIYFKIVGLLVKNSFGRKVQSKMRNRGIMNPFF